MMRRRGRIDTGQGGRGTVKMPDASAREEEAQPPTGQAGVAVPLEALEDTGGAHAAADAHGDEAVAGVAALEFANDGCGELRAGAAQGMAEGHGAAIDVDALRVESRDFDDGKSLRREGFIQFNHVNLLELQSRELKSFGNGEGRANAEFFGKDAGGGEGHEASQRPGAQGAGAFGAHDDGGGGAVAHLRRVARGDLSLRVEGGLELGEGFERCVGAGALVGFEDDLGGCGLDGNGGASTRSEEHTSELQSPCNLVCRLLIEKKNTSELQSPCNLVCRLLLEKKKKKIIETVHRLQQLGNGRNRMTQAYSVALRRHALTPVLV